MQFLFGFYTKDAILEVQGNRWQQIPNRLMKYLNRPSIHHKYIQGVAISCREYMGFTDI